MSSNNKIVVAFDLYGTLLSTESISHELAKILPDSEGAVAKEVATLWRRYQLEYTWRINSMGEYRSFSEITRASLLHAVAECCSQEQQQQLSASGIDQLMKAYDALHVFPEVPEALRALAFHDDIDAYVFSNGTTDMVRNSVMSSPDLGPHSASFKGLITVDDGPKVFKPDRRTYEHLLAETKAGKDDNVWVVSANPFDAVGAVHAGLKSAWIDRAGKGWVDRLGDVIGGVRPTVVVKGVDEAVAAIIKSSSS
ncbi:HAD-like domain-containing protein [Diplogelasinospora grovesii]|uniref:HAD-like domain-containing protein n=1 Tax=Diplogelasinospora grovesii TaxID=303347 RepID=A0AAN6NBL4_9PEZI|nr:HAD-like domain-containing protein [Diplogelasinospora grovesii]